MIFLPVLLGKCLLLRSCQKPSLENERTKLLVDSLFVLNSSVTCSQPYGVHWFAGFDLSCYIRALFTISLQYRILYKDTIYKLDSGIVSWDIATKPVYLVLNNTLPSTFI